MVHCCHSFLLGKIQAKMADRGFVMLKGKLEFDQR
jgi:hypothetical protein